MTRSSTSSPSLAERRGATQATPARVAVVACGAIAQPISQIAADRGLSLDVYPLPPLLHNRPELIAGEVEALGQELMERYDRVAVGYADCGSYGALDAVCERLGLRRLAGLHCYDVYGGAERIARFFDEQPGTYLFTDFLVRSFARTVLEELGLDRHPELRDAYFAHYTRVVWLAQQPDPELEAMARWAAGALDLPLTVIETGHHGLERELLALLADADDVSAAGPAASSPSPPPG